jgi:hypothetical protein
MPKIYWRSFCPVKVINRHGNFPLAQIELPTCRKVRGFFPNSRNGVS